MLVLTPTHHCVLSRNHLYNPNLTTSQDVQQTREMPIFNDSNIWRIKGAMFVGGNSTTPESLTQLVAEMDRNLPAQDINIELATNVINRRNCNDAPTAARWLVLECFALGELYNRNCEGKVYSSASTRRKMPLDREKLSAIRNVVFQLFNHGNVEKETSKVWSSCRRSIDKRVLNLFSDLFKNKPWLQVSFP